ncbi:hypothetical protein [Sphingomonas sp. UYEF23]|uniref:hypothetical protein n=1 Tax=Sphingomonas sp. UYEF23 TaxID=1756408 RepID=UPI00339AEB67
MLDMVKGIDPAYHDTLLASLQPKRALLTDDLGIRAIAQEAGAASTWTQAFVQAGHCPGGISHPEYRSVVAALLERHHRFTQIGNMEVLAELLESRWVINDRLKSFARVMTGPEIDRSSVPNLLARLLVDSSRHAPNDPGLAAFHREYVVACHTAGRPDDVEEVYMMAATAAQELLAGSINRVTLPPQLMATTYLHSPAILTRAARKIALRQAEKLITRLRDGGLTLDAEAPSGSRRVAKRCKQWLQPVDYRLTKVRYCPLSLQTGQAAFHPFRPFARDERRLVEALTTRWLDQKR